MKPQPSQLSNWSTVQVYTALAVVLVLGFVGGYFVRGSINTEPAAAPAGSALPLSAAPTSTLPTPQQALDAQAAPLLQRIDANPRDVAALVSLATLFRRHAVFAGHRLLHSRPQ